MKKAKSSVQKTVPYTEVKQSDMTAIDKKIHALLTAEGYAVVNTDRAANSGSYSDINVNRFEFLRGERERVFVITHELARRAAQ